jgi:hypothetical protein
MLVCAACAVAGAALVTATFYPGLMNVDALLQLQEARSHIYYDWHPPIMGRLWAVLDPIIPGPAGMLLLNNLLFWSGLALTVWLADLSPFSTAASVLAVGLSPPVFSALGVIWKDVAMGAALLLAFGMLWWAEARSSRAGLVLALPLLFYAATLRHNAAFAVLPLVLWVPFIGQEVAHGARRRPRWQLLFAGVTLFALLNGSAVAVNRMLANGGRLYPSQQVLLHDLAAISVASGQIRLPASLRTENGPPTVEGLACVYTPDSAVALFSGNDGACPLRVVKILDPVRMADLVAEWTSAVRSQPGAYLAHRWKAFRGQFAIGRERVCYPLQVGIDPNEMGLRFSGTPLYRPALKLLTAAAYRTPLFRGWMYLALAGVLLLWAGRRRGSAPALALGASGILYGLSYLAVSTSCDFRLHWWCVVAALTLLVVAAGTARRSEQGGD